MLLSDVGVGFECPLSKQLWTRLRARGGFGREVELLQQHLLRFSEHLGKEKAILVLKDRETEARHHLTDRSRSFRRQTIPTAVPTPAQPPSRSQAVFYGAKLRQRCGEWRQILPRPSHAPVFSLPGLRAVSRTQGGTV